MRLGHAGGDCKACESHEHEKQEGKLHVDVLSPRFVVMQALSLVYPFYYIFGWIS